MENKYLTVTALTQYIKRKFTADPYLHKVYLSGEISNFRPRKRHQYFSLKDENSKIDVVMFAQNFARVKFTPEEGMKVLVSGYVNLYEPSGRYQFYIETMQPDGIGALYQAYEQLKAKLEKEGLFSGPKKQICKVPKRIAVITSPSGAVIKDIITTSRRRFPIVQIVLFPAEVQGENAADSLVARLKEVNARGDFDTIIIGRGGGSIEDLWPFNEESVARQIYASEIPVISSVGHQTDTTIADLVADLRAPTPTAAAELATPVLDELLESLEDSQKRLENSIKNRLDFWQTNLNKISQSYIFTQPTRLYEGYIQRLDMLNSHLINAFNGHLKAKREDFIKVDGRLRASSPQSKIENLQQHSQALSERLFTGMRFTISNYNQRLGSLIHSLDALSPLKTMSRGFLYATHDGSVIKKTSQLEVGSKISLHLQDGKAEAEVRKIERNEQ